MTDPNPLNFLAGMPQLRSPTIPPIKFHNPAEWMHERLVRSIINFEEGLTETQEIGARLVNFGAHETIHIRDVGFWGQDLIIFYGTNVEGLPVELLQHITQISVLLVAVPKENEQAQRIGFELQNKLGARSEEDR